jgi:hypothetical protein
MHKQEVLLLLQLVLYRRDLSKGSGPQHTDVSGGYEDPERCANLKRGTSNADMNSGI